MLHAMLTPAVATALSWVAAVLYLLALLALLRRRRDAADGRPGSRLDPLPGALGVLAHLAAVAVSAAALGRLPVGNLREVFVFLALLFALGYLAAAARFRFVAVEGLLLALVLAFLGLSFLLRGESFPPGLDSRWFVFHTVLSLLGVVALVGACLLSLLYLLADTQLKRKSPTPLLRLLPSLVACDRAALRLLELGFPLLTLGILTGLLWSREARAFSFGPKELMAILAWGLSAVLLYARIAHGAGGRRAAILSVSAAAAALCAVFGITR